MGRGYDEAGEKGVFIGELDESGVRLTFHPLPGRRYERMEIDAGDDALAAIEAALAGRDTTMHCCRIILTGEAEPVDLSALHAALDDRFFALSLRDETHPRQSLWEDAGADTLKGILLLDLKAKAAQAATEEERRVIELAARYARAALEGREVPEL